MLVSTIGVYGFDRDSFLEALAAAKIDHVLDARRYEEEILDRADLAGVVRWIGGSRPALLCVERDPEACHRSLIAARLRREWGFEIEHLRPATEP